MKFSEKFANIIIFLVILYSILIFIFSIYMIFNHVGLISLNFYYFIIFACFLSVIFFLFTLKLDSNFKLNISIFIFILFFVLYSFEIFLELKHNKVIDFNYKKSDKRTSIQVVEDFNNKGIKAFPNFFPYELINTNGLIINDERIFPLSSISNSNLVYCFEKGFWVTYKSDEFGFNNSKDMYEKKDLDIILIGDSFTEGYCVRPKNTISSKLNKLGFKSISLGKSGNGPLIELATIKEYALSLKPKIVLWLYYENDLVELLNELKSSYLKQYIDNNNFSQNLISKQEVIDDVLKKYIQRKIIESQENIILKKKLLLPLSRRTTNILKLFNLRSLLKLNPHFSIEDPVAKTFIKILLDANKTVSSWNGKMYFVYLPAYSKYSIGKDFGYYDSIRGIIENLEIEIIDIHEEGFVNHPDPLSLFAGTHYNSEGYDLVSKIIEKKIRNK